ncbi:MAG: tolA [Magnetococcales bacterium]|nr:tolA [Magnetococcales bacterium]
MVEPGPKKKETEKPEKPPVKASEESTNPNKVEKTEAPDKKKPALDFSKAIAKYQDKAQPHAAVEEGPPDSADEPSPSASPRVISLWQRNIYTTVRNNWNKPSGLVNEAKLIVRLLVRVGPDGSLQDAQVVQSSGNPGYDGSVLRAIWKTRTVDPPPAGCDECRELDFYFKPGD